MEVWCQDDPVVKVGISEHGAEVGSIDEGQAPHRKTLFVCRRPNQVERLIN